MRRWEVKKRKKINFHFFLDKRRLNDLPLQSGFESKASREKQGTKEVERLVAGFELSRKLEKINFNFFLTNEIESRIFALRF